MYTLWGRRCFLKWLLSKINIPAFLQINLFYYKNPLSWSQFYSFSVHSCSAGSSSRKAVARFTTPLSASPAVNSPPSLYLYLAVSLPLAVVCLSSVSWSVRNCQHARDYQLSVECHANGTCHQLKC